MNKPDLSAAAEFMAAVDTLASLYVSSLSIPEDGMSGRQALILIRMGEAEQTVGRIAVDHPGQSNMSYNLSKLEERAYIERRKSDVDKRASHLRRTEKGAVAAAEALAKHERFARCLEGRAVADILALLKGLSRDAEA